MALTYSISRSGDAMPIQLIAKYDVKDENKNC